MPWVDLVALDRQIKALLAELDRQEQRDRTWREKRVRIADIANRAGANLGDVDGLRRRKPSRKPKSP